MKRGLVLLVFLSLLSCSEKVISHLDTKAKFQNFDSYTIVNAKIGKRQLPAETTELLGVIEKSIKNEMESKRNYSPSNIDPDLILRYELVSNTRTEIDRTPNPAFTFQNVNSRVIYESVILIELRNVKNKLVWQGSYDLNQSRKEEKNETAITKAIAKIFTTYPYEAGKSQSNPQLNEK